MVRCNIGFANLNCVDPVLPPLKSPYFLERRRLRSAHISDVSGGEGLYHYGAARCVPYLDPASLTGL